jgi:hypothetical protein
MIFAPIINTPANTYETDKIRTRLDVIIGLIYQIEVYFPPGPSGLLHVQIFDSNYQIYPSDSDSSFIGDNNSFSFPDLYAKNDKPAYLDIYTWNLDDTYDHYCQIRIGMASKEEFQSRYLGGMDAKAITALFENIQATQEAARTSKLKLLSSILSEKSGG